MLRFNMKHSLIMIPCLVFCIVPTVLNFCLYPDTHPASEFVDSMGVASIFVAMTVLLFTPPYVLVSNGTITCKWFGIRLFSFALQDIMDVHMAQKDEIRTIFWGGTPLVVYLKNEKKCILPLVDTDAFMISLEPAQRDAHAEGPVDAHSLKLPLCIVRIVFIFMVVLMTILFFRIEDGNLNKYKGLILIGNGLCMFFYAFSFYGKNK